MYNEIAEIFFLRFNRIVPRGVRAREPPFGDQRDLRRHLVRQGRLPHPDDGELLGRRRLQQGNRALLETTQVWERKTGTFILL